MNARFARVISLSVLIVSAGAVMAAGAIRTAADRAPEGVIMVVGDPDAEGLAGVVAELEQLRASGDTLVSQGNINAVDLLTMLVFLG